MPRRNRNLASLITTLAAALAVTGLSVLLRRRPEASFVRPPMLEPATDPVPLPAPMPRPRPAARLALASGFTLLFFAGAAFTAGAGSQVAALLEGDDVTADQVSAVSASAEPEPAPAPEPAPPLEIAPDIALETAPAFEPAPAPEATAESEPAPVEPEPATAPEQDVATEPAAPVAEQGDVDARETEPEAPLRPVHAAAPPAVTPVAAPVSVQPASAPAATQATATRRIVPARATRKWVTARAQRPPAHPAEIEHADAGAATIWLNRALPDPTPPSARLTRSFAYSLARSSARRDADWAAVLGVLRAQGDRGSAPASPAELDRLAASLHGDAWRGALALSGRTSFADRAAALADYHRAVGIESLVTGLEQSKDRLVDRLLADERVSIYDGGRADLAAGRIDVRIVVLLSYLAERHDSVTVSSLFSGHRRFARAGVVSAHMYGHAVDIAGVGGASIVGNQQPGGLTEAAVRSILLLPSELQPQQVISLLGLGGPSFPLADHADHIHVGY